MDEAVINAIAANELTKAWMLFPIASVLVIAFCVALLAFRRSAKRLGLDDPVYPALSTVISALVPMAALLVLLFLLAVSLINMPEAVATIDNPRASAIRIFAGK